jgi:hypothetical protein
MEGGEEIWGGHGRHPIDPSSPDGASSGANADERTRTSTWLPRHGPEPCASTNSATSACREASEDIAPCSPVSGRSCAGLSRRWMPAFASPESLPALLLASVPQSEPPSSRGLGRRPLTAVTRVRIPLAVSIVRRRPCDVFRCAWVRVEPGRASTRSVGLTAWPSAFPRRLRRCRPATLGWTPFEPAEEK